MSLSADEFKEIIWEYYRENGRHNLSWRLDTRPYYVFVSEVMLQQTQVSRVATKFAEFIDLFASLEELANATNTEVLSAWQGLGYNRRGLWLKRAAELIANDHGGEVPSSPVELVKLPGIGPNTAGSIAVFAYNLPIVFIETNIRRVFIHHFFDDSESVDDAQIRPLIEQTIDAENPREWYWALMDYGSYLPKTTVNPNRRSKHYAKQSRFEGSRRQIRGAILKLLLTDGPQTVSKLEAIIPDERLDSVITELAIDGLVVRQEQMVTIAEK